MAETSYSQFCPVAMAAEILCSRWTLVVLRELVAGTTRFNELRRGVPRISPALLSKRLKDLEASGIVSRVPVLGEPETFEYRLTKAGRDLQPVIEAVGVWGQRWIETEASLANLDPNLLMWDMRRRIDPKPMPRRRSVIQVMFSDQKEVHRNWWLIVEPGKPVDLCWVDPGFDVDLYLSTDLRTMTEVWMGYTTLAQAKDADRLIVTGSKQLAANLSTWLCLSTFAKIDKLVA
ncbi:MAG: helix-turn-helix transcriptional regulator [Hyphomicrobium sp.]|nr:helix-turn-helix transcriptional regulator [Hyphomicrobium sp.]